MHGSREVAFTILSMTMSLAAAFIPILFMSGVLGRVFREFAVTITVAILISGFVSITLTPMLCDRFLVSDARRRDETPRRIDRWFEASRRGYARSLAMTLRHPALMLLLFAGVLAGTVRMYGVVPKGFVPEQDADSLSINLRAAQGTSPDDMARYSRAASEIINRSPAVDALTVTSGGNAMNTARIQAQLTARGTRVSASQVAQQLRRALAQLTGARAFVTVPAALTIGSRMTNSGYVLTVQALNTDALYTWAPRLERAIAARPDLQDVSSDLEIKSPRVNLVIDRDKAAAVGLDATLIQNVLYDGFGQKWSTTIYDRAAQYRVLLELDPRYQTRAGLLSRLSFKAPTGSLVPLESVARFVEAVGPQTINHSGELPAVALSFALRPGASLGAAVDQIRSAAAELPPAMIVGFEGAAKLFQSSFGNLALLLVVAVATVYIVLGMLYESFVQPFTILSGLPSAGLGALITLWLFKSELNVYSFVGLIMLVGIVKKNAIMQIDVALDAERTAGKSPADAIYDACLLRYRPIMMTTVAALAGAAPIALGFGAGGEARRPLGLAVVGGLIVSQLITLYLTPAVYIWFARLARPRAARADLGAPTS
jgi:HAE1 family hydrophobic/amphiphilic exporter-1